MISAEMTDDDMSAVFGDVDINDNRPATQQQLEAYKSSLRTLFSFPSFSPALSTTPSPFPSHIFVAVVAQHPEWSVEIPTTKFEEKISLDNYRDIYAENFGRRVPHAIFVGQRDGTFR